MIIGEPTDQPAVTQLHQQYKALGNIGRLRVCQYLEYANVGTCSIIARHVGISRSLTSRHLKHLQEVGLVQKEKWFTMTVFKLSNISKQLLLLEPSKEAITKKEEQK